MLALLSRDIITRPEIKTVNDENRHNHNSYPDTHSVEEAMEDCLSSSSELWLKMTWRMIRSVKILIRTCYCW